MSFTDNPLSFYIAVTRFCWRHPRVVGIAYVIGALVGMLAVSSHSASPWTTAGQMAIPFISVGAAIVGLAMLSRAYDLPGKWVALTMIVVMFAVTGSGPIWYALLALVAGATLWRSGRFRGWLAEVRVARVLNQLSESAPEDYRVINGLLLQDADHSTEIDHVVVSVYGLFVIETKAFREVTIDAEGEWSHGRGAYPMRDPRKQNAGHVTAIRNVLDLRRDTPFIPLVALVNTTVRGSTPDGVCSLKTLPRRIKEHGEPVLDRSRVRDLYTRLVEANATGRAARREHLHRTRKKKAEGAFAEEHQ